MNSYLKLAIASLLPVIAAALLYLAEKYKIWGSLNKKIKQLIYGVIFGALAIVGTEWGIPINGAQVNCRDAAVLIAGLMFGAPAGIIAGIIGAVERWIAVAWGVGTFTRVACTVATFIAGIYAASLRKFMFEDRKPGALIAFAIGVVMEVFHLTMVFVTNMNIPDQAMAVIQACSIPLTTANAVSVMLATVCLQMLAKEPSKHEINGKARISQTIQRWLLLAIIFAFIITTAFIFRVQNQVTDSQVNSLLSLAIKETSEDIEDASDKEILNICKRIVKEQDSRRLSDIAEEYGVPEISAFDKNGEVFDSSVPENIGLRAGDYKSSSEFLCLLGDDTELVQDYRSNATDASVIRKYAAVKTPYGFLQVGFDADKLQQYVAAEIVDITKNRHVEESGYIIIIDEDGNIVSAPESTTGKSLMDDGREIGEIPPNTTIKMTLSGQEVFCRYELAQGYYIISVLPVGEALQTRNLAIYANTFMEILVFALLFGLIYMLIKRIVVNRIKDINTSLAKITGGDLDEVVNVRSNQEFVSLSDDINLTVNTLKKYIAEASARIDAELEFAKNIQGSALPNIFPAFPKRKDFDIFASMTPAKEVGGDFYDFYMTGNDRIHFLVADVSGKGIPAAMFMMRAKTELKSLTEAETPLSEVFTNGNSSLCEGNDAGMFVTAWQGNINLEKGLMQFVSAGHNPPLISHDGADFEYLRSKSGFILAGLEGVSYKTNELQLCPGDIIYLYTDGVTEATNSENVLYGEERLLEAINSRKFESMEELCGFIKSDVDKFVGEAPQFDDITMLALKYNGAPLTPSIHLDEACLDDIPVVTEFIEDELQKLDFPMKSTMQINVAIDEIMSNIVRYAYPASRGPVTVKLIVEEEPNRVYVKFEDEGIPYNPLTNKDPDVTLSAEDRKIGGLGIYIVKKTMDSVKYKYEDGKNILTLKKLY